jgi:hypothetical protein
MAKPLPRKRMKYGDISFSDPIFRPYVTALGQLALAWNALHETLALLFCTVMGGGMANQPLAIWHGIKSDRAQRDILMAAARADCRPAFPGDGGYERMTADLKWLCGEIDRLEDIRNDALHSPLAATLGPGIARTVRPMTGLGHVRAQKLAERNLLTEFRYCRDSALILGVFAYELDQSLSFAGLAWPDKPALPNRQGPNVTKLRRQVHTKERTPPLQSSRE